MGMHWSATAPRQAHRTLNQKYEMPLVIWQRGWSTVPETHKPTERLLDLRPPLPGWHRQRCSWFFKCCKFTVFQSWTGTGWHVEASVKTFTWTVWLRFGRVILFSCDISTPLFPHGFVQLLKEKIRSVTFALLQSFYILISFSFYNLLISLWRGFHPPLCRWRFSFIPYGRYSHTDTHACSLHGKFALSELCGIMTCVTKSLLLEWQWTEAALSHVLHLCSLAFSLAAALLSPLCSPHGSNAITPICAG